MLNTPALDSAHLWNAAISHSLHDLQGIVGCVVTPATEMEP